MAPRSYIRVKNTAGALVAIFTGEGVDMRENGFFYLAYKQRVNGVHFVEFEISQTNPDAIHIQDKYAIEVWRSDTAIGLSEYKVLDAIIRDDVLYTDDTNRSRLTVRAYGLNSLLSRRRIAYPANDANFTTFTAVPAETVLKRLVQYNADSAFATVANGRDRTASTMNLTVQADAAQGNIISWNCGGRNELLSELQKIAAIAGGDFDTIATGVNSYQFRFYVNQLGTNRTTGANAVIFSVDRGNMGSPKLPRVRSAVKTVAIVGGTGEEDARVIRVRTGAAYSAANDIETYVDGRNASDINQLDGIGDQTLEETEFKNTLEFDVLQTPLYAVEKDYFLGDLTLARYAGVEITQQVYEITRQYENGREKASIVMRDL